MNRLSSDRIEAIAAFHDEEEVRYMAKRLLDAMHENETLAKLLNESETTIMNLRRQIISNKDSEHGAS